MENFLKFHKTVTPKIFEDHALITKEYLKSTNLDEWTALAPGFANPDGSYPTFGASFEEIVFRGYQMVTCSLARIIVASYPDKEKTQFLFEKSFQFFLDVIDLCAEHPKFLYFSASDAAMALSVFIKPVSDCVEEYNHFQLFI